MHCKIIRQQTFHFLRHSKNHQSKRKIMCWDCPINSGSLSYPHAEPYKSPSYSSYSAHSGETVSASSNSSYYYGIGIAVAIIIIVVILICISICCSTSRNRQTPVYYQQPDVVTAVPQPTAKPVAAASKSTAVVTSGPVVAPPPGYVQSQTTIMV